MILINLCQIFSAYFPPGNTDFHGFFHRRGRGVRREFGHKRHKRLKKQGHQVIRITGCRISGYQNIRRKGNRKSGCQADGGQWRADDR